MAITLEGLLTHPGAFGLTTATPVQRAICRVADGLPLGNLRLDPDVQWAFGGAEALLRMPACMPDELFFVAAVRGAKTLFSSALAFRSALTCDVSGLRKGEVPRVSIVSLDLDKAAVALEHLNETIPTAPLLRPFFIGARKDTIVIRHPGGRPVQIKVVAGKKAGGSLVSRWSAGAIFDEAPRMQGQEDGVVNFEDSRKAVMGRLLPGAQLVAIGSPWAPRGPVYDAVQDSWGKPNASRVVVRGKGPMLNPFWWTKERIAKIEAGVDGQLIVQTDCWAEFGDLESQFFTSNDYAKARRDGPLHLDYDPACSYAAFMDPATRGNAWAVSICQKRPGNTESEAQYAIAWFREWKGSRSDPLKAKAVFRELAPVLSSYGLAGVTTDRWSADAIREHGEDVGIEVEIDEATEQEKAKRYLDFRELVISDPPRMSLPPDPQYRADMLAIKRQLLPGGGLRFQLPLTNDGRHADFAPTAVGAADKAAQGATWTHAMDKLQQRGYGLFEPDPRALEGKPAYCWPCGRNYIGRCPKHGIAAGRQAG